MKDGFWQRVPHRWGKGRLESISYSQAKSRAVVMRTSSVKAMVGPAVLSLNAIHAWREALHLAAMCKRMEYIMVEEERYKSLSSPSDGASDYIA